MAPNIWHPKCNRNDIILSSFLGDHVPLKIGYMLGIRRSVVLMTLLYLFAILILFQTDLWISLIIISSVFFILRLVAPPRRFSRFVYSNRSNWNEKSHLPDSLWGCLKSSCGHMLCRESRSQGSRVGYSFSHNHEVENGYIFERQPTTIGGTRSSILYHFCDCARKGTWMIPWVYLSDQQNFSVSKLHIPKSMNNLRLNVWVDKSHIFATSNVFILEPSILIPCTYERHARSWNLENFRKQNKLNHTTRISIFLYTKFIPGNFCLAISCEWGGNNCPSNPTNWSERSWSWARSLAEPGVLNDPERRDEEWRIPFQR